MPDFIHGTELNLAMEQTIQNAGNFLWLISPSIQLHDRLKSELTRKKDNPNLTITLLFAKQEDAANKSISAEDIAFLKGFPSVKICCNKTLNAKFYANEFGCLITSLNLHDFSLNTNIETGVYAATKGMLGKLATDLVQKITNDTDFAEKALGYFDNIINNSDVLFHKIANFDNGILGFNKKYTGSSIKVDALQAFFDAIELKSKPVVSIAEPAIEATPPPSLKPNFGTYVQQPTLPKNETGFCIRTGVPIVFNPANPFSADAYKSWAQYGDWDFPENYCHTTGRPSYGRTTMRNPSL